MHIYLHIPFCKSKCTYCDFVSGAYPPRVQSEYVSTLIAELRLAFEHIPPHTVQTIYIGGGTPSSLNCDDLTRLLKKLSEHVDLQTLSEFTIECNPESVSEELIQTITKYHVKRVSLGVQSSNEDELRFLNRIHSFEQVKRSVQLLRKYGITNYSLDLMFNLPNQTMPMLQQSINEFLALDPTHISCYSLIIEHGTPMMRLLEGGKIIEPSDESYVKQYRMIIEQLAERGYRQYEIASFSKEGYEAVHNSAYWLGKDYLGLGTAAHSKLGSYRFANVSDVGKYIERAGEAFYDHSDRYGIPTHDRSSFGTFPKKHPPDTPKPFEANSILEKSEMSDPSIRQESFLSVSPFIDSDSIEQLSPKDHLNELFFLGLRRNAGISREAIEGKIAQLPEEKQETISAKIFRSIDRLRHSGLLDLDGNQILLTQRGREISNSVFVELMIE